MAASQAPLRGLRVIDLAEVSGAYCGKLLADMGADVVLVEPPGGAAMRRIGPFWGGGPDLNRSLFFWHYSTNKRSIVCDLDRDDQRAALLRLISNSDVLIETLPADRLIQYGLDYASLAATNPRLIHASITPYGRSGPLANLQATDLICQATGGLAFLNGSPADRPLQGAGLQAYHSAGMHAALGVLAALLRRECEGGGTHIDVSVQRSVEALVEHATAQRQRHGRLLTRPGRVHWTKDFCVGRAANGFLMHAAVGDWTTLSEWVCAESGSEDLKHPAWSDREFRRTQHQALFAILDHWAASRSADDLVAGAQLRRLPYSALGNVADLVDDPQLSARRFFAHVPHPELATEVIYPGAPYVLTASPWRIVQRPPLVGEHTSDVAAEIERPAQPAQPPQSQRPTIVDTQKRALDGIRVLDFTWAVAGPLATRILADHGAEVIKIERPGSSAAGQRARSEHGDLNRRKQSVAIDLNEPRGRELVCQLAATADVVIDNFSPRVMAHWQLDYRSLCRLRADIIAVSMSAFGHDGPHRDHVAWAPTLHARAGYNDLMRDTQGAPVGWGSSFSDVMGGLSGAIATLLAIWHRKRTGKGQFVDLSQYENLVALHGPRLLTVLNRAALLAEDVAAAVAPIDNRSQEMPSAPHCVFRCADPVTGSDASDRWCAIAVRGDDDWRRLREALGNPAWSLDERFSGCGGRIAHQHELHRRIAEWTRERRAEDVMNLLQGAGVPAGLLANAADLVDLNGQVGAVIPSDMATGSDCEPFLGEHTESVLQRLLALPPHEIAALRAAGTIE